MTRSQYCREHIDKVAEACGLEKSTVSDVKQAAKFCDERSEFSDCSTHAIMALIRVKDEQVRERAISLAQNALNVSTPTGGKVRKSLTEREIKKLIEQADKEVRKELMKEDPPGKDHPKAAPHNTENPTVRKDPPPQKEKPIRCMYLDKAGTGCYANAVYQQKCTVAVRENRNCPLPIVEPSSEPKPPQRLTTEYCRSLNCPHLKKREMNNTLKCEISEKVPGNMAECPLKGDQGKPSPEPSEFLLRQISKCRLKRCPELIDDETTTLCKVMEAYAEKGSPWNRYDCPLSCMNTDPEFYTGSRVQGQGFAPTEECRSAVVHRSTSKPTPSGNVTFTVYAGRHEVVTARNMVKYGDALDENEAIQTMFKDGASHWLDKIERRIQEDGIGDECE